MIAGLGEVVAVVCMVCQPECAVPMDENPKALLAANRIRYCRRSESSYSTEESVALNLLDRRMKESWGENTQDWIDRFLQ